MTGLAMGFSATLLWCSAGLLLNGAWKALGWTPTRFEFWFAVIAWPASLLLLVSAGIAWLVLAPLRTATRKLTR